MEIFSKLLRLLAVIVLLLWACAAPPPTELSLKWQKCFGGTADDVLLDMQRTSDGGYIFVGSTSSSDGDLSGQRGEYDAWVVKIDQNGKIQWQRCLGGSTGDEFWSVQETSDGYIAAGYTLSSDVPGNHGGYDALLVKFDKNGNVEWIECLGGSDNDYARAVQQTTDDGYIVAGYTLSNDGDVSGHHGGNGHDFWVVKLDKNRNIQWQECLGGTSNEICTDVQQTFDGGYVAVGQTASNDGNVTENHGGYDGWVVKLDGNGDIQWQKCLGGSLGESFNSVRQTPDGGYVVVGGTRSNDGDLTGVPGGQESDLWIVKLDANGNIQWQKRLGGSLVDVAISVALTSDGGYAVVGVTQSNDGDVTENHGGTDIWMIILDQSGNVQWKKCFGGSGDEYGCGVQQTPDGGYMIAGHTTSNDGDVSGNDGGADVWIAKLGY